MVWLSRGKRSGWARRRVRAALGGSAAAACGTVPGRGCLTHNRGSVCVGDNQEAPPVPLGGEDTRVTKHR